LRAPHFAGHGDRVGAVVGGRLRLRRAAAILLVAHRPADASAVPRRRLVPDLRLGDQPVWRAPGPRRRGCRHRSGRDPPRCPDRARWPQQPLRPGGLSFDPADRPLGAGAAGLSPAPAPGGAVDRMRKRRSERLAGPAALRVWAVALIALFTLAPILATVL